MIWRQLNKRPIRLGLNTRPLFPKFCTDSPKHKMNKKIKKLLKRQDEKPFNPLRYQLRALENTKILYEQNKNLPVNVRMANIQLVQNDIVALKKRLKKSNKLSTAVARV